MRVDGQNRAEKKVGGYRIYSTYIFRDGDEVTCEALSVGDYKFKVGKDVLRDVTSLMCIARHIRSKLELVYKNSDEWEHRTQTYIHIDGLAVPVDHVCAEVNGFQLRIDFTAECAYVKRKHNGEWFWTTTKVRYKGWKMFASRIRRAALGLR